MLANCARNIGSPTGKLMQAVVLAASLQITSTVLAQDDEYINPDRPGIADGSKVVGAGRVQMEVGIQKEFRRTGPVSDQTLFVPTLFRGGIDNRWEVRVESNTYMLQTTSDPGNGVSRAHGFAPISIGTKYQFLDAVEADLPSLGVIVRVFPASGSREFRSRHTTGDVRLAADWDFADRWSLNPNVGVAVYEDDQNRRFNTGLLALTLSYNPSKTLSLFVDTGMQSREAKYGRSAAIFDVGVAYLPTRDVQLDFSLGGRAHGDTPPRVFVALGLSGMF